MNMVIKCPKCGFEIDQDQDIGEAVYSLYINGYIGKNIIYDNIKYREEVFYTKAMAINELTSEAHWLLNQCQVVHGSIYVKNKKIHTFKLYRENYGNKNEK